MDKLYSTCFRRCKKGYDGECWQENDMRRCYYLHTILAIATLKSMTTCELSYLGAWEEQTLHYELGLELHKQHATMLCAVCMFGYKKYCATQRWHQNGCQSKGNVKRKMMWHDRERKRQCSEIKYETYPLWGLPKHNYFYTKQNITKILNTNEQSINEQGLSNMNVKCHVISGICETKKSYNLVIFVGVKSSNQTNSIPWKSCDNKNTHFKRDSRLSHQD